MSVSQQQAAGAAYAAKIGKIDPSELEGASLEMYKTMTKKQLRDFAKTKHEGLPDKIEEQFPTNWGQLTTNQKKEWLKAQQETQDRKNLRKPSRPKITIQSSYKMDEECGCDEEENEEDPRSMKTKKDLIKNKLRAMGLKMSYEPEGNQIDEINDPAFKNVLRSLTGEYGRNGVITNPQPITTTRKHPKPTTNDLSTEAGPRGDRPGMKGSRFRGD